MSDKTNFIEQEKEVLHFWEENNIFQKLLQKNSENPPFRFLDGPITANNPMGVHHAWGRTIKDVYLRYHAMNGKSCHYRNGFDTQGLWVEVEVEKELGFQDKKDIEHYGLENFTQKCKERVSRFSSTITQQSKRLGQWMDWENSYYTHTDENIEGIWYFLKKCHENGWLTESHRPLPWCPRCGTSLSEHEMTGSYAELTHTAVYAKLPVTGREFDILVWTTTPWTLSANIALAVHPDLDYAVVRYNEVEKPLLLAKSALHVLEGKKEILYILKGSELEGLSYETFFPQLPAERSLEHKIVLWDDVSASDGCGVVHIAPGCGAEDFALGLSLGLPALCPVDESGHFVENSGFLSGLSASEAASVVFSELQRQGKLFKTHLHTHSYPVCWRCKTEVIFRLVRSWVIKTEEIKPQLLKAVSTVHWEPEHIGKRMQDWLTNMGDWNISRKRFYGLPLPFYPCPHCGKLTVVGSKEELRMFGGEAAESLPELHRPWIDEVKIACPHCGGQVSRIPDVGDVWLDAGIVPFTTLGYFTNRESWENQFPVHWVTEMREQVRLWFYSLLFMSVTLTGKAPYQRVLAYSSVVSEDGSKFSKTGFMVPFNEAAERIGADAVRYLFAGAPVGSDVRFGYLLGEEARRKLLTLWNIYTFFMTYAGLSHPDVLTPVSGSSLTITDRWLAERMNAFVQALDAAYQNYDTPLVVKEFEACAGDVSNWYIRVNRRRFWEGDRAAFVSLYQALKTLCTVMAPVIPFLAESIWQNCIRALDPTAPQSVHLADFPHSVPLQETKLLLDTAAVRSVISLALAVRSEKRLKVKQPLRTLFVAVPDDTRSALQRMEDLVIDELNVKELVCLPDISALQIKYLTLNFKTAGALLKGDVNSAKTALAALSELEMADTVSRFEQGQPLILPGITPALPHELFTLQHKTKEHLAIGSEGKLTVAIDTRLSDDLLLEGAYRELLRQCQMLRKEADFRVDQPIHLAIRSSDSFIIQVLSAFGDKLTDETLAVELDHSLPTYDISMTTTIAEHPVTVEMKGL